MRRRWLEASMVLTGIGTACKRDGIEMKRATGTMLEDYSILNAGVRAGIVEASHSY